MTKKIIIVCLVFFFCNITNATLLKGTFEMGSLEQSNHIQSELTEYLLTLKDGSQVSLSVSPDLIASAGGMSRLINQRAEVSVTEAKKTNESYADYQATAIAILPSEEVKTLTGKLLVIRGDREISNFTHEMRFTLVQQDGSQLSLNIDPGQISNAGGIAKVRNKQVRISVPELGGKEQYRNEKNNIDVLALTPIRSVDLKRVKSKAVSGSQRYVSLLCKFADKPYEPKDLEYFTNMYGMAAGQLGHYWKEVSSNNINLEGSSAYDAGGSWYTLPNTQSYYAPTPGSGHDAKLTELLNDCTALADADVDFSNVKGINLMFNDSLDCCSWGGSRFKTLDGVTKLWSVTWAPPWGWSNGGTLVHEMGHSFGLPHSNNSDGDANPYDSPWSIMSSTWDNATVDITYGTLGKHLNAYEKYSLGWMIPAEVFTVPNTGVYTLDVDPVSYDVANSGAYRLVKIPVSNGGIDYYTIEVRETTGYYEANLPGAAVIIHTVVESRSQPSWVVDGNRPAADFASTEGVMWKVGETFIDQINNLGISVDRATDTGFRVTVERILTPVSLISPNGTSTDSTPRYLWNADSAATDYNLWVEDSTGNKINTWYSAAEVGCSNATETCSFKPSTRLANGNVRWWVRARNSGSDGPWSNSMTFILNAGNLPAAASLIAPDNIMSDATLTYSWGADPLATQYYLWVNDSTGNKIQIWYSAAEAGCASGVGICSVTPSTLLAVGNVTWWVQTRNTSGAGPWSSAKTFTITTTSVPSAAILLTPSETIADTTPTYSWNAVAAATWYYLWVDDITGNKIKEWYSAADAGCADGTGVCSATISTELAEGNVRWWVQTGNKIGSTLGPWSSVKTFTLSYDSVPGAATLLIPSGTIADTTPTYSWHAVAEATWYYLWVDDMTGNKIKAWYSAADAGCADGTGVCSATISTVLAEGNVRWWIQTGNKSAPGPWSSAKGFVVSTEPAPSIATLLTPTETIGDATPEYSWNAVAGATWYYLWVDDSTGNKIKHWYTSAEAGCANGTGVCKLTPAIVLAKGSARWWIQAWNIAGYGSWSSAKTFILND